ncbi:hypothetical protein AaE_003849, partial [Aphanomyces astaci]
PVRVVGVRSVRVVGVRPRVISNQELLCNGLDGVDYERATRIGGE